MVVVVRYECAEHKRLCGSALRYRLCGTVSILTVPQTASLSVLAE